MIGLVASINEIVAFWFGLFETENRFTMYLFGSKENDDWASNECKYGMTQ